MESWIATSAAVVFIFWGVLFLGHILAAMSSAIDLWTFREAKGTRREKRQEERTVLFTVFGLSSIALFFSYPMSIAASWTYDAFNEQKRWEASSQEMNGATMMIIVFVGFLVTVSALVGRLVRVPSSAPADLRRDALDARNIVNVSDRSPVLKQVAEEWKRSRLDFAKRLRKDGMDRRSIGRYASSSWWTTATYRRKLSCTLKWSFGRICRASVAVLVYLCTLSLALVGGTLAIEAWKTPNALSLKFLFTGIIVAMIVLLLFTHLLHQRLSMRYAEKATEASLRQFRESRIIIEKLKKVESKGLVGDPEGAEGNRIQEFYGYLFGFCIFRLTPGRKRPSVKSRSSASANAGRAASN